MKDSEVIWINGKLAPYESANIHILTHSLHYGCAVFEGIRAYRTASGKTSIFRCAEHYKRLFSSMEVFGYSTPYSVEDLIGATKQVIQANKFEECYIRPIALLGESVRGLKLPEHPKVDIAIATWKWGKYMGAEGQEKGVRLKVSSLKRPDVPQFMQGAKLAGSYLISVLARREATQGGYDEALLLDPNNNVGEGSGENFFIVKDGIIYTPPATYILPGITRNGVMTIAKDMGLTVKEENFKLDRVYEADEAFFTGTAVEVNPVREVDNRTIGNGLPGPITLKLKEAFFKCTQGQMPQYESWNYYV